ncbi:MAG TPA: glyoxalase [Granulicella sp.]
MSLCASASRTAVFAAALLSAAAFAQTAPQPADGVAVGAQYDTTHVYISPASFDAFVKSFVATFGGNAAQKSTANVLPVPGRTETQYVWTPAGALSVFGFETPIPVPFGQERTGYLVTNMDDAIKAARASGAEVLVVPFQDPIGRDAVIQWDGGVKTQLYWHFTPRSIQPFAAIPDNRVYVSPDRAARFVKEFLLFSHGKVVSDDPHADAGEIGRPGEFYRSIRIESRFGRMLILVTDGHLPYPFGHETTGYAVADLDTTLAKAKEAGVTILVPAYSSGDLRSAMVEFPGGYIAEIHGSMKP